MRAGDWAEVFKWSPYTEWYLNSWSLEGSPTAAHHAATYGDRIRYLAGCSRLEALAYLAGSHFAFTPLKAGYGGFIGDAWNVETPLLTVSGTVALIDGRLWIDGKPLHDADASRHCADRAERNHASRRNRNIRTGAELKGRLSRVSFNVVVCGVQDLPHAVEIRVNAIRSALRFPRSSGRRRCIGLGRRGRRRVSRRLARAKRSRHGKHGYNLLHDSSPFAQPPYQRSL